ncbi:DUF2236 domain-containing protein [Nocardia sp. ET3-3]|uniref:DUF2236 domain-containing protein n=1 Tax=Nocardia terrae TaxID=2675851 RepID=A0A7K1V6C9_9NOCA|nr:oxygenase MpaB family protein [Nocardia terrae]MVU82185.1 DUF2236 domain-containing protein [Nocardia terrae]
MTVPFDAARAARIARARDVLPDEVVDRVVDGMFRTDSVIDSVVEDFAGLGRGTGWRLLGEALRHRDPNPPSAPDSLRELLTPLLNPPDWFDPIQIRRGAQLWWRFAPAVIIGMGGTLITAYRFGDLNKPQAMNSRSETMAARRYEETSRWVLAATDPGTLVPGGTGFDATIRIRFVHAMVRRHLRLSGAWQRDAWGDPIHATGMAVTADAFLLMPLSLYGLFDMTLTADELEAIRQLWCWIGCLMGIPDNLLAHSIDDAGNVSRAATIIFAPPDEDTETLTRALLRTGLHPERLLPQPFWRPTAPVLRPVISTLVWGGTGRIVTAYSDPDGTPPRHHPAILTLRQVARARKYLRRTGRLGSDERIAETQRRILSGALDAMKAASAPVDPRDAVTPKP